MAHVYYELVDITKDVAANLDTKKLWDDIKGSEVLYFSIAFVIIKFMLRPLKTEEQKKTCRKIFTAYNLFMCVFSLVSFLAMAYAMYEVGFYGPDCEKAFANTVFRYTAQAFYLSKYLEYIDSFYLPLVDKPFSFLQFFHHLGAPWDMWIICNYHAECVWIFVFLNGFIHFIMYGYYYIRLIGKKFPMPKMLITSMQITQFNLGFYLVWCYKDIPCFRKDPFRMAGWLFNYWYVGMVLFLFLHFFLRSYIAPKSKSKTQ